MAKIYYLFMLTLLVEVFVAAFPEIDSHHLSIEAEEDEDTYTDGEDLQEHQSVDLENLENYDDLTASGEVLSETDNCARSRRSLEAPGEVVTISQASDVFMLNKPDEGNVMEDMEAAETAIFMPAHLRLKKKRAVEECREKNREFTRYRRANPQRPIRWQCNDYCCYYVVM